MKDLHFFITYILGLIVELVVAFIAFLYALEFVDFILRCIYHGLSWLCDRFFFALPIIIVSLFTVPMWFIFRDDIKQIEAEESQTKNVEDIYDDITEW